MWVWFAVISALMTLKYFPGLENEGLYAGNVFQVLNPDAFPNDISRSPDSPLWERPTQLSLFYVFVWLGGVFWLDDRFVAIFYLAIVAVSLIGIDRIAQTFGLTDRLGRLMLLLFFAKDHQILTNKVLVAHHQDVNPSALAIPCLIWLFYFVIARFRLVWVLALCAALALVSVRLALFACVSALIAETYLRRGAERWVAFAFLAAGVAGSSAVLGHFTPSDSTARQMLWDAFVEAENNDANPFAADGIGNMPLRFTAFALIIGLGWFLTPDIPARRVLRVLIVVGTTLLLLGGIYISYAPDMIKLPLLISFVPARISIWLQNLCYIGVITGLMFRFGDSMPARMWAVYLAVFAFMYIAGIGNIGEWTALLLLSLAVSAAAHGIACRTANSGFTEQIKANILPILTLSLLLSTVVNYANAINRNIPAWESAIRYGVYGDNPSAAWVNVAPHIVANTPPESVVLTFRCRNAPACDKLHAERSLASRTGRSMSVPEVGGAGFDDTSAWERIDYQKTLIKEIETSLGLGDLQAAGRVLERLSHVPDVLVIPERLSPNNSFVVGAYTEKDRIDRWIILFRE
jgi:hypothetical protein